MENGKIRDRGRNDTRPHQEIESRNQSAYPDFWRISILSLIWILNSSFSYTFSSAESNPAQSPSLTPVSFADASIQDTFEWCVSYLSEYHTDFSSIRLEIPGEVPGVAHLLDPQGNLLKTLDLRSISQEKPRDRVVFDGVASLILDTGRNPVAQAAIEALRSSWYWDAKARSNAAIFDLLAHAEEESINAQNWNIRTNPTETAHLSFGEAEAFWRYRYLMQQQGGRRGLWRAIQEHPKLLEWLDPTIPLPMEDALEQLELIHFLASPVWDLETSARWFGCMSEFAMHQSISDAISWYSIDTVPLRLTTHDPAFRAELISRISWIKENLPRVNPLYLNAFQSLGVCFEQILSEDLSNIELARQQLVRDRQFVQQITRTIEGRRKRGDE